MLDEEVHGDESTNHYRTLSERGQNYFEAEYTRCNRSVTKAYQELTTLLEEIPFCSANDDLKTLESSLNSGSVRHAELCD